MKGPASLEELSNEIISCRRCPRLVAWREEVAAVRRKAYRDWKYWGRPLPGFGDPKASMVIVGLAPAAHGGNRTGRMFTGDRSGDFLYAGLYHAGFANQPTSTHKGDGLKLRGVYIVAAARCAPPDNKPLPEELSNCSTFLDRELALLRPRVLLALGAIGWEAALGALARKGIAIPRPKPKFSHGAECKLSGAPTLVGCYHVSQQNTQTGKLTGEMFDRVLERVKLISKA